MGLFLLHFWTAFGGFVINLIMCYLLIGRAKLNMVGAGIANNLQMVGNFLCIIFTVLVCKRARNMVRRPSRESCKGWLEIIKLGIPSYLMMFLDMSALEVFVILSNYVSEYHLSANGTLLNIFYLSIIFSYSLVQSVDPLVGQSLGAGHVAKAKRYGYTGWIIGMTWAILYAGVCVGMPKTVFSLLNGASEPLEIMANSAPMLGISMILDHS